MPFVPFVQMDDTQRQQVRGRRPGVPDETLMRFAFWVRPDGKLSTYGGMLHLDNVTPGGKP
jgi:hypothetical protein